MGSFLKRHVSNSALPTTPLSVLPCKEKAGYCTSHEQLSFPVNPAPLFWNSAVNALSFSLCRSSTSSRMPTTDFLLRVPPPLIRPLVVHLLLYSSLVLLPPSVYCHYRYSHCTVLWSVWSDQTSHNTLPFIHFPVFWVFIEKLHRLPLDGVYK